MYSMFTKPSFENIDFVDLIKFSWIRLSPDDINVEAKSVTTTDPEALMQPYQNSNIRFESDQSRYCSFEIFFCT